MRGSRRFSAVVSVLCALVGLLVAWAPSASAAPVVSSFAPTSGGVGTAVTITGSGFTSVSAVQFNGTVATYTVKSATTIATSVPHGATSGPISVTAGGATGTSSTSFTVTTGEQVAPTSGPPTTNVTVYGSGFGAREAVDVYAGTTDIALTVSDANGNVSVATQVPASAQPGTFWFTLVGRRTGTATQASFLVRTPIPQAGVTAGHTSWNRFENTITPENAGSLDLAWSRPLGIVGSPAVANGAVYLASSFGAVYALNATTGAQLWAEVFAGDPIGTPAVIGSTVVVAFDDGSVKALNASTGITVWSYLPGTSQTPAGPPTVTSTGVYVVYTNGVVEALSLVNGTQQWQAAMQVSPGTADTANASAAVSTAAGLVITNDPVGRVFAWNISTGAPQWASGDGKSTYLPPVIVGNRVFEFTGYALIWFGLTSVTGPHYFPLFPGSTLAGAVGNGLAYVTDSTGTLTAARATDGSVVWQTSSTKYTGTPFLAGGVLWVEATDDQNYAIDPSTGAVLGAVSASDTESPVVSDGRLFVTNSGTLDALTAPTATSSSRPRISQLRPDRTLAADR